MIQFARAGGKAGLVGFHRLHMKPLSPVQSARGAILVQTSRPQEQARRECREERVISPVQLIGALRGAPARKGRRRQRSGSGSGEGFPQISYRSRYVYFAAGPDYRYLCE